MPRQLYIEDNNKYRPATDAEIISACASIWSRRAKRKPTKLTPAVISKIKRKSASGMTRADLKRHFQLSYPSIDKALRS